MVGSGSTSPEANRDPYKTIRSPQQWWKGLCTVPEVCSTSRHQLEVDISETAGIHSWVQMTANHLQANFIFFSYIGGKTG
jgi:hypothetical protein